MLASWHFGERELSCTGRFGPRLPETFHYIAEIISCFDVVAVQEVNRDLSALERRAGSQPEVAHVQMSVHSPLWVEIETDFSDHLKQFATWRGGSGSAHDGALGGGGLRQRSVSAP